MHSSSTVDPDVEYFSGARLYGDDFGFEQIRAWHEDEKNGYADLGAKDRASYRYGYHALNRRHGFRHLPEGRFAHVLGIGSAWGDEFEPIADRVDRLTILESASAFEQRQVHGIEADYADPTVDGTLPFPEDTFDLITCFGVLHHIPNVSLVVSEIARCLQPGGVVLLREPVVSLGDWRKPRSGLTKRERGIPLPLFRRMLADAGLTVQRERLCIFSLVPKIWNRLGRAAYASPFATWLDDIASSLMGWNLRYHPKRFLHRFRPQSVFFVLRR